MAQRRIFHECHFLAVSCFYLKDKEGFICGVCVCVCVCVVLFLFFYNQDDLDDVS